MSSNTCYLTHQKVLLPCRSGDRGSVNRLCAKHINGRVTLILLLILLRVIFAVNQENSELTVASRERLWWIHF